MDLNRALINVIDSIYAAAFDAHGWPDALKKICGILGSRGACVFTVENATQHIPVWIDLGIGDFTKDYRAHYASIDPRARYAASHPHTRIHYDYMLIDERGMDRNEFYAWQSKSSDNLRYFIGCRLPLDAEHTGFAAFHWQRKQGHVQSQQIQRFRWLARHIEHALLVGHKVGTITLFAAAMEAALDSFPFGIVLLDRSGRVVTLNRVAETIVSANDGLSIVGGRLTAKHSDDDNALQQLFAAAVGQPAGDSGVAIVRRPSRHRGYVVAISPLAKQLMDLMVRTPAICVHISDPEQRRRIPTELLGRLYGLTRAEAEIAIRLAHGMTVKQAAAELGIATNTGRVHLHRILAKTGTHRQMDLVRLLLATVSTPPA